MWAIILRVSNNRSTGQRLILSLSGGFGFLLSLYAGLLVVLSLSDLGENAGLSALSFESSQSTIQGFVFLDADFCHLVFPPSALTTVSYFIGTMDIIQNSGEIVKRFLLQIHRNFSVFHIATNHGDLPIVMVDQLLRDAILHLTLNGTLQGTGTELAVITMIR